jgi:Glycerophosphoryl diester phosphodiesterase family
VFVVSFEIQAHRGNDPLVLRLLLAAAPSSIEVDVGLSPAGLVVAHEPDLSDVSGLTVEGLLGVVGDTRVVLEAKCFPDTTPSPSEFVQALRPFLARVSVASFDERLVATVARLRPSTPTTFLFERPLHAATAARTLGPRQDLVTRELIAAAHGVGARVVPWTVNDVQTMAELIDLGVDGLVTDQPALAQAVVTSRLGGEGRRSVA